MSNPALPPVAEALLARYTDLTSHRLELSTPQDTGQTLKDHVVHEQLLRSLRLVAKHSAAPLLDTLLYWRSEALKGFRGKTLTSSHKKLVIETAFLEAVLEIMEGAPAGADVHSRQANSLLKLAFEWVLKCHIYVPDPELEHSRSLVTQLCGRLIGGMTPFRLANILDSFMKELRSRLTGDTSEAHLQERATLFRLCDAMKAVRLGFKSDEEVIMSAKFLEDIHPLKHVAREKKSQVHHALCDMLTVICRRLSASRQVGAFAGNASVHLRWYKTVENLRTDISKWALDQKKHYGVGFPLMAVLISLEPDAAFDVQIQKTVDEINLRLMKESKTRPLTLHCLQECIQAYLDRHAGKQPDKQIQDWLKACLKAPLGHVVKGTMSLEQKPGQDLGATMLSICQIVAAKCPEVAVQGLILELMNSDQFSCQTIGLQALRNLVLSAPAYGLSESLADPAFQTSPSQQVMDMIRAGTYPLNMYGVGHLSNAIGDALGRILSNCGAMFGGLHLSTVPRSVLDHVPKEKLMGLVVLKAALLCIPYVSPSWTEQAQADMLAGYTKHAHQDVRQQATRAMYRVLRCQASMRPHLIAALAQDVKSVSDEHPNVMSAGLRLLIDMCGEWRKTIQEGADPDDGGADKQGRDIDAAQVKAQMESLGLICLASNEPSIRIQALELLRGGRSLHRSIRAVQSASRSVKYPQQGSGDGVDPTHKTHIIDIIEQAGDEIVQSCYWDFGRYSNLWRDWRAPPSSLGGLSGLISNSSKGGQQDLANDPVRWGRFLSELARHACNLCPDSVSQALEEITSRCYKLFYVQEGGQSVFRVSPVIENLSRFQLWHNYSAFAFACATASKQENSPRKGLTVKGMMQLVLAAMRASQDLHMSAYMAVGNSHVESMDFLLDEIRKTNNQLELDKAKAKGKVSGMDVRAALSQAVRIMACNISEAQLMSRPQLIARYLDFVVTTADFCQRSSELSYWDCQPLRYCCCSVVAACVEPMMSCGLLSNNQRKMLFSLFDAWSRKAGELGREVLSAKDTMTCSRELQAILARVKDVETMRALRQDLLEQTEALQTIAACGQAALLAGPSIDGDMRLQGVVGNWIHGLLNWKKSAYVYGPPLGQVARKALKNLLSASPDLLSAAIDRCYETDASVSNQYFHVMVEVYCLHPDLQSPVHILLSLVLYKLVNPNAEVRDDALELLNVMSSRVWTTSQHHGSSAVVGNLQDTYQQFQCQLSSQIAAEHPELSEQLCVEMLTRVLNVVNKVTRHQVLVCLPPWMQNLSFSGKEGSWCNDLLKSLYFVTWQHGTQFPYEVERLWSTLATNKRNVIPILDFLVCKGLDECAAGDLEPLKTYFSVAKRISLYLSRVASQQTVDHLVYEVSQQLHEDDNSYQSMSVAAAARTFLSSRPGHSDDLMDTTGSDISESSSLSSGLASMPRQSSISNGLGSIGRASLSMRSPSLAARSGSGGARGSSSLPAGALSEFMNAPDYAESEPSRDGSEKGCGVVTNILSRSLGRSELALCLLAEVAYEHDEDFRRHLPLLFHVTLIFSDSTEGIVSQHCRLLVVNLLYSISFRHLEAGGGGLASAQTGTLEHVKGLIKVLQSTQEQQLWGYEEATLDQPHLESTITMTALTESILQAIIFESDLRERWGNEALSWAVGCSSRHLSARSLQVFRALKLPLASNSADCLLYSLHLVISKAAKAKEPMAALECALEIILTLQTLVDGTVEEKLILYPQLFWTCIALLPIPFPQLYCQVLSLLFRILEKLDLNQVWVQNVVVAAAPGSSVWQMDLSLDQSPPGSLRNSLAKEGQSRGAEPWELPWGETARWRLGGCLLSAPSPRTDPPAPASQQAQPPPYRPVAVQQLLLKGLYEERCEMQTVAVMMQLAAGVVTDPLRLTAGPRDPFYFDSLSSLTDITMSLRADVPHGLTAGIGVVLGPIDIQFLCSVVGLLPWAAANRWAVGKDREAAACMSLLSSAALAQGHGELSHCLSELAREPEGGWKLKMSELGVPISRAFFPRHARMFCQLLTTTLSHGPRKYHSTALALLESVLQVPDLQLGNASEWLSSPGSFAPVAEVVGQASPQKSQLAQQALAVLDLVMQRFPGDASKRSLQIKERWRVAGVTMYATRGDTAGEGEEGGSSNPLEGGYQGEELLQPTNGMEIACKALEAVLGTCHKANTSRVGKRGLMPFCNSISREI